MAATLLILLGGIIGVGFIGNLFFERTRIPAVLLLIAIGIFLGPITRIVPPEAVRPFMPFFGAIALTIILFEGGLDLDLQRTIRQAGRAVLLAALSFVESALSDALAVMVVLAFFGLEQGEISGSLLAGQLGKSMLIGAGAAIAGGLVWLWMLSHLSTRPFFIS